MASSSSLSANHPPSEAKKKKKNQPDDGPATSGFESDDFVKTLMRQQQQEHEDEETFGLVLVAGWPASPAWRQTYVDCVRPRFVECFPSDDGNSKQTSITSSSNTPTTSAVYFYPPEALHVTLATFWSIHQTQKQPITPAQQVALEQHVQAVVERTWQGYEKQFDDSNSNNNDKSIALEMESAQIGSKAGILLWKDTNDGRIDAFRTILQSECREECETLRQKAPAASEEEHAAFVAQVLSEVKIPNIIHSTVVRFAATPETAPAVVQETFRRTMLKGFLSAQEQQHPRNVLDPVTLVRERRPYMHVPQDDGHIAWRKSLSTSGE